MRRCPGPRRNQTARRNVVQPGGTSRNITRSEQAQMAERDPDRISAQLADGFDHLKFRDDELEEQLDDLVTVARRVFGVAGAGLMLLDEHEQLGLVGASDDTARALERTQVQTGIGPGVQSTHTDQIVTVEDLAVDSRWPQVSERLRGLEVRGVLSAPIAIHETTIGNLNLFDREPRSWTDADVDRARALATVVAIWLRAAVDAHDKGQLVSRLQQSWGILDPADERS
jgi:transcriptional regulator with GAF, ATPase, and Fis domain